MSCAQSEQVSSQIHQVGELVGGFAERMGDTLDTLQLAGRRCTARQGATSRRCSRIPIAVSAYAESRSEMAGILLLERSDMALSIAGSQTSPRRPCPAYTQVPRTVCKPRKSEIPMQVSELALDIPYQ